MVCSNAANPPAWACNGGSSPVPPPGGNPPSPTTTVAPPPATTTTVAPPNPTPNPPAPTPSPPAPTPSPPASNVEYWLLVEYDYYAWETTVSVVHQNSGTAVATLHGVSPYDFEMIPVSLLPGEQYSLTVSDSYGDGMPMGWAAVDVYVDGWWYDELAYVDGWDFDYDISAPFGVPTNVRRAKVAPDHVRMNTKKNFCRDSLSTFIIDDVELNCEWLKTYWPRTKDHCEEADVALACPGTCGHCDVVKEPDYN